MIVPSQQPVTGSVDPSSPCPPPVAAPFAASRRTVSARQPIALISVQGDPSAAKVEGGAIGQSVYVRQVGEALAKLGWQVDIFTRKAETDVAPIIAHGPYCRTVHLPAGPPTPLSEAEVFPHLPEFIQALRTFQSKQGSHYPLLHTNGWLSAWSGLQLRQHSNVQLVHTYHTLGCIEYQACPRMPAIAPIRHQVEQQILQQADRVVATSPQEQESLHRLIATDGRIEIIPCGADLDHFRSLPKAEARAKLGLAAQAQVVLYVGRFATHKGVETLIRAFAQCYERQGAVCGASSSENHLQLLLVGSGQAVRGAYPLANHADDPEWVRLENLVQSLGLQAVTQFVGQVSYDRLPLYYTAADVCVIPSHYEPFGLVAIEAMACGTPVVASDVGGLRFTVMPGETGLLVPAQDVTAFARSIERVLADASWAEQLKQQAADRVRQTFSWASVAGQLSDLYRRLLAQSITQEQLWVEGPAVPWPRQPLLSSVASRPPLASA
ncbi:glycosyltransferase [Trichothermofontia sp.]